MRFPSPLLLPLSLIACRSDSLKQLPPIPIERPPLTLTVSEPPEGSFVGTQATVTGKVSDPAAVVYVEGYRVNVAADGTFQVVVPVDDEFRIIDAEAVRPPNSGDGEVEHLRERRVVYAGSDPLSTWTGGIGIRVTPTALDHVSELIEAQIAALDLSSTIETNLPALGIAGINFVPVSASADPVSAELISGAEGLALQIGVRNLIVRYNIVTTTLGTIPVTLGIDSLGAGGTVGLALDADGALAVSLEQLGQFDIGAPVIEVAGVDPEILEIWLGSLLGGIGDTLTAVISGAVSLLFSELSLDLPEITLPETLLGFPLTMRIGEIGTDVDGVAVALTVDAGVAPTAPLAIPTTSEAWPGSDLAISLHEGLLQGLLSSDLLTMLDLDLELPGFLGEALALPIAALPGGEQLPSDRTGMCLSIEPGQSGIARLGDSLLPLATIIMPDLHLSVGVSTATLHCSPWLEASLALRVELDAQGTAINTRIEVADGAVLAYDANGVYSEDEIIGGLGGLLDVAMSLLGGDIALDLADLFGAPTTGVLGELQPRLLDARPTTTDGVAIISLSLY